MASRFACLAGIEFDEGYAVCDRPRGHMYNHRHTSGDFNISWPDDDPDGTPDDLSVEVPRERRRASRPTP